MYDRQDYQPHWIAAGLAFWTLALGPIPVIVGLSVAAAAVICPPKEGKD